MKPENAEMLRVGKSGFEVSTKVVAVPCQFYSAEFSASGPALIINVSCA